MPSFWWSWCQRIPSPAGIRYQSSCSALAAAIFTLWKPYSFTSNSIDSGCNSCNTAYSFQLHKAMITMRFVDGTGCCHPSLPRYGSRDRKPWQLLFFLFTHKVAAPSHYFTLPKLYAGSERYGHQTFSLFPKIGTVLYKIRWEKSARK